jgi:hypothetical protein
VADEALQKIGTMLEDLGVRFELVVEAVTGYGGRFDKLRDELFGQFAEVGSQIRFLSEQIAENRNGMQRLRADFGAEMVRINEALGRTRVEFREQLGTSEAGVREEMRAQFQSALNTIHADTSSTEAAVRHLSSADTNGANAIGREAIESIRELRREIASSAELTAKRLANEMKQTAKTITSLSRKFERFDDRITVQVKDQEQRLKKLEAGGRRR